MRDPSRQLLENELGHVSVTRAERGQPPAAGRWGQASVVEAELDDVAVLHDVVLALHAGLALRAGLGDRAGRDQVLEADDLGLDEALLEVGVDDAGRLRGRPALADRPGARLLGARREVGLQTEGGEADPSELVEAALVLAGAGQQLRCVRRDRGRRAPTRSSRRGRPPRAGATSAASSAFLAGSVSTASSTLNT